MIRFEKQVTFELQLSSSFIALCVTLKNLSKVKSEKFKKGQQSWIPWDVLATAAVVISADVVWGDVGFAVKSSLVAKVVAVVVSLILLVTVVACKDKSETHTMDESKQKDHIRH